MPRSADAMPSALPCCATTMSCASRRRFCTSSSPIMPRSMNVSTPVSRLTSRLPGCGSAWKNPSTGSCLMSARSALRAISSRSSPAAWMLSTSLTLTPSTNSWVMILDVESSRVDDRHVDARQALHVLRELEGVVGLAAVVELLEHAGRELLEHAGDVQRAHHLRPLRRDAGGVQQDPEVGADLVGDQRPLHLDGDLGAVVEERAVHLRRGGRRERLGLERGVQLLRRRPQLLDDRDAHLVAGERRHVVLQARELLGDVDRQGRGLAGDDLADLDVGRPELLQHHPQPHGGRRLLPSLREPPDPPLQAVAEAAHVGCALEHDVHAVPHQRVVDLLQAQVLAHAVEGGPPHDSPSFSVVRAALADDVLELVLARHRRGEQLALHVAPAWRARGGSSAPPSGRG